MYPGPVPSAPFAVRYVSVEVAAAVADHFKLAEIHFGHVPYALGVIHVPLTPLTPAGLPVELWTSAVPIGQAQDGDIDYRYNGDVLFGSFKLDEGQYEGLAAATSAIYRRLYDFIANSAYPNLLRVWNYLADINGVSDGLERYQQFCQGRHQALFDEPGLVGPDLEHRLPAASAIGVDSGSELLIYFLASRTPGIQIENPRQTSAFCYPHRYGPKSPSFSRAILSRWASATALFVSGTASIVGHETRHLNDARAQLDETLHNLEALLAHAALQYGLSIMGVHTLNLLKLYVRHPAQAMPLASCLRQRLGSEAALLVLKGDLCRDDLLLEIEGLLEIEK